MVCVENTSRRAEELGGVTRHKVHKQNAVVLLGTSGEQLEF